jgi:hypothetical protein
MSAQDLGSINMQTEMSTGGTFWCVACPCVPLVGMNHRLTSVAFLLSSSRWARSTDMEYIVIKMETSSKDSLKMISVL